MDICHLKNSELEPQYLKYKGRVVLRGHIVKDDSGSHAVFTEHGPSTSQMTAAKVMDIMSRPRGCAGQAADAISAYTQVKMEDVIENSEVRMSRCLNTSTKVQRAKIMVQYGRPNRSPLERNLYGHPLARLLWERQFEKVLLKHGWQKFRIGECSFVNGRKGPF